MWGEPTSKARGEGPVRRERVAGSEDDGTKGPKDFCRTRFYGVSLLAVEYVEVPDVEDLAVPNVVGWVLGEARERLVRYGVKVEGPDRGDAFVTGREPRAGSTRTWGKEMVAEAGAT